LRKQLIELIQNYVQLVQKEKNEITGFIQVIGNKLIEMQKEINNAFSYSNKSLEQDIDFNETLGNQIKGIGNSVNESNDFDSLKSLIISELLMITETLDKKRKEYIERIEKSNDEKTKLQQHFDKMIKDVMDQNRDLIEKNQKDSLTGIYNRITFEELINGELQRYQRYQEPFSLILFDIDHFKKVNDIYGHEVGDRVLKGIAQSIGDILRKSDIFARYGGEEFIILLPKTNIEKGINVSEKLRLTVQDTEFLYDNVKVPITVSVGVTEIQPTDKEFIDVFNRADSYMYQAKNEGRNKVISDSDMDKSEHH
jgi:diguanylate cyclase